MTDVREETVHRDLKACASSDCGQTHFCIVFVDVNVLSLGMKDILQYVETKQLKWYRHVKRMPDDRLPHRLLNWKPTTSRLAGCPRKLWMDNVKVEHTGSK